MRRGSSRRAGRRGNSRAQLKRAHGKRCPAPVPAVNPASIVSATHQLTLHFHDDAHVYAGRRQFIGRAAETLVRLDPRTGLTK